jgi:hypothetical protein
MKSQILLSFLLCFFSISAIAQERPQIITIKGTITGAQPPVYLFCETQIHTLELSGDRFQTGGFRFSNSLLFLSGRH